MVSQANSNSASPSTSGTAGITQVTGHDKPGNNSKASTDAHAKAQAGQRIENGKDTLLASRSAQPLLTKSTSISGKTVQKSLTAQSVQQPGADAKETSVYKSAANVPASSVHGKAGSRAAVSNQHTVVSGK